MAWNRSVENDMSAKQKPNLRTNRYAKYIVAAICLGALGIVAMMLISDSDKPLDEDATRRSNRRIGNYTNAVPRATAPVATQVVQTSESPKTGKQRTYIDANGVERYKLGNGRVLPKDYKKYIVEVKTHSNVPTFRHNCELEIATLLTLQPGDAILGEFDRGERFKKDFVQALLEPVEIEEGDSEEDIRIKKDVEAVKKELAQRLKQGEDVGKILDETREDFRRLNAVKEQVKELIREKSAEAETPDDIEDLYAAANKMLESKGLAPIKMNAIMRKKLSMMRQE